ncbi:ubiquinone biosynthesis protein [Holotrichia oblita]|uniref:Ubiquinone biosynthesis protein n=1 Tax=Holotrichia oblita TaxID=644536 RepID=A0ACB9TX37_HOLOL|nr:ubiquinone biosynthesis protein [Holotrichia oblita]
MIVTTKLRHVRRAATLINKAMSLSAQPEPQISNDFEEEFQKHHIPISLFQRVFLGIGSAAICIMDPTRPEMIACMGEATGDMAMKYMLRQMENSPEGSEILKKRPRINSKTVDLEKLKTYPEGTLGKIYTDFLKINGVTPDSRSPVSFVEDIELAYVMQRYREVHDLVHTILQMPTNMLGEISVKWVEGIQTKLPMCIGGAVFGPLRLKPKNRDTYKKYYLPWAIRTGMEAKFLLNVYYEQRWEQPLVDLLQELNITPLKIPVK